MEKFNEKLAAQVNATLEKLAAMPMPAQQAAAPAQGKGWIPRKPHEPIPAKTPMPAPAPIKPAVPAAPMMPGKTPLGGGPLGR